MKAVGYIRVSSEMQIETGHSLGAQRTLITDYVRAKGWTLSEVFCDPGLSGTLSNRPALRELMSRAEQREFDVVIVYAIDRFYRDLGGLLTALHHLQKHRVTFVSITENLDFTTPWGKLVLAVLGALAEIYIDKLREETKKGKQARARKGLWNGSIPFGYCNGLCASCTDVNGKDYCPNFGQANRSHSGILIAHPIESVAVRLTFGWYEMRNWSHRLIAEKLNAYELILPDGSVRHFRTKRCPSLGGPQRITRSTVREMLSRIFYTGQLPYYGTNEHGIKLKRRNISALVPGQHPALISQELFDHCQEIAGRRLGNLSRAGGLNAEFAERP
ncbi:MAG: recombinase family protein [Chloroflexi bacterium]|nr:recombinase family protein [Chloroflexota bacterium]